MYSECKYDKFGDGGLSENNDFIRQIFFFNLGSPFAVKIYRMYSTQQTLLHNWNITQIRCKPMFTIRPFPLQYEIYSLDISTLFVLIWNDYRSVV